MLQFGAAPLIVEGVEVFGDHADPAQFWYLPAPVQLAQGPNGPVFTLILYEPSATDAGVKGGGFLMFETALPIDTDLETRIKAALPGAGKKTVSPVVFDEGDVQCVALNLQGGPGTTASVDGAFHAVEAIMGASVPSLFGDNVAMFSLSLSEDGAILLEKVFAAGGSPVGVIYRLKFTGLRPALHVHITADLHKVYTELSAGLDAQVYWVKLSLDAMMQKLQQDGVIKIEVISFTTDADRDQQEQFALQLFTQHILQSWFEPTLSPTGIGGVKPPAGQPGGGGGGGAPVGGGGGGAPPVGGGGGGAPPVGGGGGAVPVGGGGAVPVGGGGGAVPVGGGGGAPPVVGGGGGAVPVGGGGGAVPVGGGGSAVPVGGGGAHSATPALAGAAPVTLAAPVVVVPPVAPPTAGAGGAGAKGSSGGVNPALVTFRLHYGVQIEDKHFEMFFDRTEAVQRTYAPQGFFSLLAQGMGDPPHTIKVDLTDPFFQRVNVDFLADFDFAAVGLTAVDVMVTYGSATDQAGVQHTNRQVEAATRSTIAAASFFMSENLTRDYTYRIEYHFSGDAGWRGKDLLQVVTGSSDSASIDLNPRRHFGFLSLTVQPGDIDTEVVRRSTVSLRVDDGDWSVSDEFLVVSGGQSQLWKVRTSAPDRTAFSYSVRHEMTDGSTRVTDEQTTSVAVLSVNDPFPGQLDISLVPAWDPAVVRTVVVDLAYDDPANSFHLEKRIELEGATQTTTMAHLALADSARRSYSHRITLIGKDGVEIQRDVVTTTDTLLVIPGG